MRVLVCIKRVPAPGGKVLITEDGTDIDTRHLGFTIGPHEECAVEEAVQLVAEHGGHVTVLTAGPPEAEEQLRYALSMGANAGVLVEHGAHDPQATATALTETIRTLESEDGNFDLILFGNESADVGNYQVGIRVACALERPVVGGIKGIDVADESTHVLLHRENADGVEVYQAPLPAVAAVKEGLNLPRYPSIQGRLRAKKAPLRTVQPKTAPGGLRTVQLRQPPEKQHETVVLGYGADAADSVVDLLTEKGVV
ncbi:electron transfer flavoprotein beta subunit [Halopolyspora algeriensis]|uniref:Electron transfer flavoprotein small subunit n=1 Tax=Halopolyspora algeriensis TaxID=1500506 RepID=A0A368VHR9_9ACTN|nr:electron transfer flavoprotein subunit beta/FixA family protein [Halopolyspora algeriensis]RCW40938.1 electron transfer flavoprotein beta subunit [Halopolyspora algeriensis]TQM53976.1 electron transfer flavoprotein beta subunit [Halopolyspora algeriensis]